MRWYQLVLVLVPNPVLIPGTNPHRGYQYFGTSTDRLFRPSDLVVEANAGLSESVGRSDDRTRTKPDGRHATTMATRSARKRIAETSPSLLEGQARNRPASMAKYAIAGRAARIGLTSLVSLALCCSLIAAEMGSIAAVGERDVHPKGAA